jgi:hypothetical protein
MALEKKCFRLKTNKFYTLQAIPFDCIPDEHDSDSVVEDALPKDQSIHVDVNVEIVEYGENGDWIRCGDETSESQKVDYAKGRVAESGEELEESVQDPSYH